MLAESPDNSQERAESPVSSQTQKVSGRVAGHQSGEGRVSRVQPDTEGQWQSRRTTARREPSLPCPVRHRRSVAESPDISQERAESPVPSQTQKVSGRVAGHQSGESRVSRVQSDTEGQWQSLRTTTRRGLSLLCLVRHRRSVAESPDNSQERAESPVSSQTRKVSGRVSGQQPGESRVSRVQSDTEGQWQSRRTTARREPSLPCPVRHRRSVAESPDNNQERAESPVSSQTQKVSGRVAGQQPGESRVSRAQSDTEGQWQSRRTTARRGPSLPCPARHRRSVAESPYNSQERAESPVSSQTQVSGRVAGQQPGESRVSRAQSDTEGQWQSRRTTARRGPSLPCPVRHRRPVAESPDNNQERAESPVSSQTQKVSGRVVGQQPGEGRVSRVQSDTEDQWQSRRTTARREPSLPCPVRHRRSVAESPDNSHERAESPVPSQTRKVSGRVAGQQPGEGRVSCVQPDTEDQWQSRRTTARREPSLPCPVRHRRSVAESPDNSQERAESPVSSQTQKVSGGVAVQQPGESRVSRVQPDTGQWQSRRTSVRRGPSLPCLVRHRRSVAESPDNSQERAESPVSSQTQKVGGRVAGQQPGEGRVSRVQSDTEGQWQSRQTTARSIGATFPNRLGRKGQRVKNVQGT